MAKIYIHITLDLSATNVAFFFSKDGTFFAFSSLKKDY